MEQQIKMAAKLYRCRDTVKRFFGYEYKAKIEPYKILIAATAKKEKMDELKAIMHLCEDEVLSSNGWIVTILMAAGVELIEPSEA